MRRAMKFHLLLGLLPAVGAVTVYADTARAESEVVALVYPSINFGGTPLELHVGDQISSTELVGLNKSVKIIKPCGVYLYTGDNYGGTFIFITSTVSEIGKPFTPLGTLCIPGSERPNNQYDTVRSIRCVAPGEVPQPTRWVPVDGRDIPTERPAGACDTPAMIVASTPSQLVLTVRKAFIWESTDCWDCAHGPWEELGVRVATAEGSVGFKFAGPTPYAHDKPLCGCWPSDEWGDDRQGMIYSNYGILDWSATSSTSVDVVVQGGNEYPLIETTITRSSRDPVLAMSNYGYVVLQNVEGLEPRICTGDKYVADFPVSDGYWDGPNGPFHNYPLKGTRHFPFDSLDYALSQTPEAGTLVLAAGHYPVPAGSLITQPVTLKSCGGHATIGDTAGRSAAEAVPASPNCSCGPF